MKLEMKDTPGQLVAALQPISEVGGNIIAVIHQHEPGTKTGRISVQIVLALPEARLNDLMDRFRSKGISILRIGKSRLLHTQTVLMIGHLMHTDIADTVDRIDCTGFAEVTELNLVMPAISERSSARFTIKSVSRD
ncbi:MAG: amino acid-binding protein, partial [Methanoregulaceae archaeon]|nr:amino acid-binding protein [Methanoregulaceae archaeon]